MDINFTFFVQLFHFLVAYQILEKLVCRPTIKVIEKEKKNYSDLIAHITAQQQELTKKENYKQNEWNRIKLFFSQSFPSLARKKTVQHKIELTSVLLLSDHEEQEYQQKVEALLMQRLRNVV